MATKAERDKKLLEMSANVKAFALKKKAALEKELVELKKVKERLEENISEAVITKKKPGVVDEINELLK